MHRMKLIAGHDRHGMLKFQSAARREKITAILTLTGVAAITLGLAWTVCYWYSIVQNSRGCSSPWRWSACSPWPADGEATANRSCWSNTASWWRCAASR